MPMTDDTGPLADLDFDALDATVIPGFYPVIIQESRYRGAYSRGRWVLTAGSDDPHEHTDAFASDTPCRVFWDAIFDEAATPATTPVTVVERAFRAAAIVHPERDAAILVASAGTLGEALTRGRVVAAQYAASEADDE